MGDPGELRRPPSRRADSAPLLRFLVLVVVLGAVLAASAAGVLYFLRHGFGV